MQEAGLVVWFIYFQTEVCFFSINISHLYFTICVFTYMDIIITINPMSTNTATVNKTALQYRTRKPQYSPYYQCIEDNYEEFKRSYERIFKEKYGYLRPHIEKVIYQFMDCGILRNGFARVKCKECNHEYLLAFSCKRRHFCPSYYSKRVVEFGE